MAVPGEIFRKFRLTPRQLRAVAERRLSPSDKEVLGLLYSHDLDDMLGFLPELEKKLSAVRTRSGKSAWRAFNDICEEWTVYARYSPRSAKLEQAEAYLETVEEVKKWLKQL